MMAAADLLVSPTRYDSYGLAVHEAICRGLPAIVSKCAGVAERFPDDLRDLLLDDPNDPAELARRMRLFESRRDQFEEATKSFGAQLRSHTWNDMAAEIVALASNIS
jgi:glycosyltransferase involved in cell wall biosynthesis